MSKQIKEKFRNAGTMTESAFWSFIRSKLRQASRWWKPFVECKNKAKRRYIGDNKRQLWEYQCYECKNWYSDKETQVDHIIPCGSLNCYDDVGGFVEKLFDEGDNLGVICKTCHNIKTQNERASRKTSKNT